MWVGTHWETNPSKKESVHLNIDLRFQNWQLVLENASVRQFDDGTQVIRVTGDCPEGWRWRLYVSVFGRTYFNSIPLNEADDALVAVLTREDLAFGDAVYTLQLAGEREGLTRHTNPVRLTVGESLSGDTIWPEVPASFTAAQRAAEAAAAAAEAAAVAAKAAAVRALDAADAAESGVITRAEFLAVRRLADATDETLDVHINDAVVHITAAERAAWDETYDYAQDHQRDDVSHITAAERAAWNAKAELPAVTAADNGKFLRVANGAYVVETVPSAESEVF